MKKILVFGAPWCKPCESWKRMLNAAGIKFEYKGISIEENEELARKYEVMNLPTTLVINSGKVVFSYTGAGRKGLKELKEVMKK